MGKACELCGEEAKLFCKADQARLCWSCDAKIHGANFLFARHTRLLLCRKCGAETECQTWGPCPSTLSRDCASCDPILREGKDDSVDSQAGPRSVVDSLVTKGSGLYSCGSQESRTDGPSGHAGAQLHSPHLKAKSEQAREVSVRRRGEEAFAVVPDLCKRPVCSKRPKFKRTASSTFSISVGLSDGTVDNGHAAARCGAKRQVVELLAFLPPQA